MHVYLFSNINPSLNNKNKSEILDYVKDYSSEYIVINKEHPKKNEILNNLNYPIIFKPDLCSGFAHNVEIIKNKKEANRFIDKSIDNTIIQKFHPGPYEGTILYTKNPISNFIKIIVVERIGSNTDKNWLWKSSIAYKYKYYSTHRPKLETNKLKKKIIEITNKLPNVYYCRYDIRFVSHDLLKEGLGFKIIEVNLEDASDTRWDVTKGKLYNINIIKNNFILKYNYGISNIVNGNSCKFTDFINKYCYYIFKITKCNQQDKYINIFKKMSKGLLK